jgi:hypothetical protein
VVATVSIQPGRSMLEQLPAGLGSGAYFLVHPRRAGMTPVRFTIAR